MSLCTREVVAYSYYFSLNVIFGEYARLLDGLESDIWDRLKLGMIVAGDFNAKTKEWGSNRKDRRGDILLEFATGLRLTVENVSTTPSPRVTMARMSLMLRSTEQWDCGASESGQSTRTCS